MNVTPLGADWHGDEPRKGPVVVGVSPTTGSPKALRWAADYARTHGMPLLAVMAWRPPRPAAVPGGRPPVAMAGMVATDAEQDADAQLRDHVAAALTDVEGVECRAVRGSAVSALLRAAADAQLLVIGETRTGRAGNVRTGLVAPQVVLRAACPVVVMPRH